jgi:hypothetical protein
MQNFIPELTENEAEMQTDNKTTSFRNNSYKNQ